MPLESIPVVALSHSNEPSFTGNALPLLHEIAEHVRRLLQTGETAAIDLSALPLNPADLEWLRERLGVGELAITLDAEGESTLSETACHGVWWITHRNERGAVTAEFIEVTFVPELVRAHREDVARGLELLELTISDLNDEPGGKPS